MSSQPITRQGQDKVETKHQIQKEGWYDDFECGKVVGATLAGLSISETADLLGIS